MDGREENYLKRFFHYLVLLILAPWFTKHSKQGTNLVMFMKWWNIVGRQGIYIITWGVHWDLVRKGRMWHSGNFKGERVQKPFLSSFFRLNSIWLSFSFLVSHLTKYEPRGKPHRYPPFDLPLLKGDAIQTQVVCQITVGMIPLTAQDPVNSYPSCVQKRILRRSERRLSAGRLMCPVLTVVSVAGLDP